MLKRVRLPQGHYFLHTRLLSSSIQLRPPPRAPDKLSPCPGAQSTASSQLSAPPTTPPTTKHIRNPSPIPEITDQVEKLLISAPEDDEFIQSLQRDNALFSHAVNHDSVRKIAQALASGRRPLLSLRFLSIVHSLGCKLKNNAYECVAFCLAQQKNWNGVIAVVSLSQQHRGRISSRLLNWRTRAQVECEDYNALQHTLKDFGEEKQGPSRRTFHLILSGHLRNRNLPQAKRCFEEMAEAGYPPDASTHAIVATHYRRLGTDPDVEARALEALSGLNPITAVAVLNSLITLRLDVKDVDGALRLLTLFNPTDIKPIVSVMTDGKGLAGLHATSFQQNLNISTILVPNAATYSIFINYQASRSNLHGALQIFRAMVATTTQATPGVVASLIHALYVGNKGDIAIRVVAQMCSMDDGLSPLFDSLLLSKTARSFPWLPTGISPTIRVFNSLLKGVLSTHGLRGMEVVLRIMHKCNVKPSAATLEILMRHVKRMEFGHARLLSRILRRLMSADVLPTLRHAHIVLSTVIRTEKNIVYGFGWDNTAARFSNTRSAAERPYPTHRISNDATFFDPMAGIELPHALRHRSLARPMVESLQSRNILSDSPILALRIRHDALIKSDLNAAKEIFDAMLDRGIHPNEYHFSALMEGFSRAGDVNGALNVMESAKRAAVKPNVVMFTIIIVGYAHKGNPDKAIQTFEDMISSGIAPDVPSIDAVASAFFVVGAYDMAKTVLRTLWTYIQPFPAEFEGASMKRLVEGFRLLHNKQQRYGDFELPKQDRLALHFKLKSLITLWCEGDNHEWRKPRYFKRTNRSIHQELPNNDSE
ncbi:hypothetical protein H0H87_003809 [Tephrocybe sp. NHM501043]|nr:hypothetical protein H0H87_003809 [Tephrocybe sp. NHM501043]